MLILDNDVVKSVLTMEMTIAALEESYLQLIRGEAVCRPRIDLRIPHEDPSTAYIWGTMEGGSTSGYLAIRMKSDVMREVDYAGVRTQDKYCVRPGLYCGLVLLMDTRNGEPLALIHDGHLQHMRMGGDDAIGAKYAAREDADVIGMFGSGGMARTSAEALCQVRPVKRIQVFSPTREHREAYASEMQEQLGVEVVAVSEPREAYRDAKLISCCTDSLDPVIEGEGLEPGSHITCIGGWMDRAATQRIDTILRLGWCPPPRDYPDYPDNVGMFAWEARPGGKEIRWPGVMNRGRTFVRMPKEKIVYLKDVVSGGAAARSKDTDVTYSERGNIQGAQFFPIAGRIYELAKERGLGNEIPTEWLLQDIRD